MRVLITGQTTSQAGRPTQLGILNAPELFAAGLRELGHTVDHRPPLVDDPELASYDVVLVGMAPAINFTAGHAWPALWTLGNAKRLGVRLGLYVDDWRLFDVWQKTIYLVRNRDKLLKPVLADRRGNEWLREKPEELQRIARALTDGRPWPPLLAPAFTWGDQTDERWLRWLPSRQLVFVDPSVLVEPVPGLEPKAPSDRERVWVNAALENPKDVAKWRLEERFSWPLEHFGSRNAGQPRVPESEVVARYHQVWGVVCLPHNRISGLGWWRNRYVYAAQAGAVLSAWPEELGVLASNPGTTGFGYEPIFLEQMSADELADVARRQANTLRFTQMSRDQVLAQLDFFLSILV